MRYAHTNLIALDWERLVDFYTHIFHCKIVPPIRDQAGEWLDKGTGLRNAQLKGAHLRLPGHGPDGPTLEIYQYDTIIEQEPILPNQRGFGHLAFEVEDIEFTTQQVLERGGTKQGDITTREVRGKGRITFIYVRDPEGNLIELQIWN